jgi:hypothetical protein
MQSKNAHISHVILKKFTLAVRTWREYIPLRGYSVLDLSDKSLALKIRSRLLPSKKMALGAGIVFCVSLRAPDHGV